MKNYCNRVGQKMSQTKTGKKFGKALHQLKNYSAPKIKIFKKMNPNRVLVNRHLNIAFFKTSDFFAQNMTKFLNQTCRPLIDLTNLFQIKIALHLAMLRLFVNQVHFLNRSQIEKAKFENFYFLRK